MFPNFIGLTWENQKTSFSMFLTFRDPNGVQITLNFAGASFYTEQDFSERRKCNRGGPREKWAWSMRPDAWAAWGLLVLTSLLGCRQSSSRWIRLDLKPSIKRVPLRVAKESAAKTQNHETGAREIEDRRGKLW
jgi:hypothetical protein